MSALPLSSDVDLFRYCEGIVDLDAEISNGAFDPPMAKKKLDGPKVARPSVDQGRFGSPQGVGAK
jgi:hypothetical protein